MPVKKNALAAVFVGTYKACPPLVVELDMKLVRRDTMLLYEIQRSHSSHQNLKGRHRFVNLLGRDDRYGENKPRLSLCRMLWRAASATLWGLLTSAATLHQNASLSHGGYHRSQGFTINQALARVRLDL